MDATKHLTKNKATVEKLANALLERETLTGEEIREIVFGKKQTKTIRSPKKNTNATKTKKQ
jgi:ATP-dependent Zn protease